MRFGRLTVISEIKRAGGYRWKCRCDCGIECSFLKSKIVAGENKSCGCLKREWQRTNDEYRLKMSQMMKQRYADGRHTYKPSKETSLKGLASRDMEKVRSNAVKLGKRHLGQPNTGRGAATPDHALAIYWKVCSPNKEIIEGWNLNYLVRSNSHLFRPEDLVWKQSNSRCRASKGLRSLFEVTKDGFFKTNSWKGWTVVDRTPWCGPGRRKRWSPVIGSGHA